MCDTEHIGAFLQDRDAPCPCCGYNLRNLTGSECPECGARLTLALKGTHDLDSLWHAAVVFFAIMTIMTLFISVPLVRGLIMGDSLARSGPGIAFALTALATPFIALAIIFSRRYLLRSWMGRLILVAITISHLVAVIVLLLIMF